MEVLPFEMEAGQLNQVYEKIKNCRVVPPPYDVDGFYSKEFYLDKRLGLKELYSDPDKTFIDDIEISSDSGIIKYYYYTKVILGIRYGYIGALNAGGEFKIITPNGFRLVDQSPTKITYGKGIRGPKGGTITVSEKSIMLLGRPAFKYTGTSLSVGDYIIFNNIENGPGGMIARVDLYDAGTGYVTISNLDYDGTAIPAGATADRYAAATTKQSESIVVGHTDGFLHGKISTVILDGYNEGNVIAIKRDTEQHIIDVINFDGDIFALTQYSIYFSRSVHYNNLNFRGLDIYPVDGGEKLFDLGEVILLIARKNKIYASVNATGIKMGYVQYDINYNGNLFSKYSQIFADQTIYILQDDARLMQVDTKKVNSTTYELVVKNVLLNSRGIFERFKGGTIDIHSSQKYLNFIHRDSGNTTNYQFDKQLQHWLIHEYSGKSIYKIEDEGKVLANGKIYTQEGFIDDATEYEQEINFSVNGGLKMYMPYILRTMFALNQEGVQMPKIDLNLKGYFDIGGRSEMLNFDINNHDFDLRLNSTPTSEELIGFDEFNHDVTQYNGTIVSLQQTLLKTGRFIRFKYNSINRFCIGPSYILTDTTKTFINEIN